MLRLALLAFVLSACDAPGGRTEAPDGRRPNLVLFLVDDLGWQDTSVAFSGAETAFQRRFATPSLVALAGHGLVFANAHAQCVCTPTRLSILTGENAARHGTTNWTLDAGKETSGTSEVLGPPPRWRAEGYRAGTPTLPGLLREHGYRTIHVGKAHFGALGTPAADPRTLGFDVSVAGHAAGAPGSYRGESGYDSEGRTSPSVWAVPGLERFHGTSTHLTEALTTVALEEVERAVADGRPFFLELSHYAVHVPLEPHAPWYEHYRAAGLDEAEARYASMVAGVDASLGALVAKLEALGVAEDTLIAFTSDNGGLSVHARGTSAVGGGRDTHNAPLREGKGLRGRHARAAPVRVGPLGAGDRGAARLPGRHGAHGCADAVRGPLRDPALGRRRALRGARCARPCAGARRRNARRRACAALPLSARLGPVGRRLPAPQRARAWPLEVRVLLRTRALGALRPGGRSR